MACMLCYATAVIMSKDFLRVWRKNEKKTTDDPIQAVSLKTHVVEYDYITYYITFNNHSITA